MRNVPGSVRTLRSYYRGVRFPSSEDFEAGVFISDDREAILVMTSVIEQGVNAVLLMHFPVKVASEKEADDVFRFEGPLGTFSARIEIAWRLGLIDEVLRGQLDDLREIRNAAAHSLRPVAMDVPEVAAVVRRLLAPTGFVSPVNDSSDALRAAFKLECLAMFQAIREGSREKAYAGIRQQLAPDGGLLPWQRKPT